MRIFDSVHRIHATHCSSSNKKSTVDGFMYEHAPLNVNFVVMRIRQTLGPTHRYMRHTQCEWTAIFFMLTITRWIRGNFGAYDLTFPRLSIAYRVVKTPHSLSVVVKGLAVLVISRSPRKINFTHLRKTNPRWELTIFTHSSCDHQTDCSESSRFVRIYQC